MVQFSCPWKDEFYVGRNGLRVSSSNSMRTKVLNSSFNCFEYLAFMGLKNVDDIAREKWPISYIGVELAENVSFVIFSLLTSMISKMKLRDTRDMKGQPELLAFSPRTCMMSLMVRNARSFGFCNPWPFYTHVCHLANRILKYGTRQLWPVPRFHRLMQNMISSKTGAAFLG